MVLHETDDCESSFSSYVDDTSSMHDDFALTDANNEDSNSFWPDDLINSVEIPNICNQQEEVRKPSSSNELDLHKLYELLEISKHAGDCIEGKDIMLLLGQTGVGKTTTLLYLAGLSFIEKDIDDYVPIETPSHLTSFKVSNGSKSCTEHIGATTIEANGKQFVICDSPGFSDTKGIETDIANTIGLVQALHRAKSVKPILIFNKSCTADRYRPLIETLDNIIRMMGTNKIDFSYFDFIFTNCSEEDSERIPKKLLILEKELDNEHPKYSDMLRSILNEMILKSTPEALYVDPSENNQAKLFQNLITDWKGMNPIENFKPFISKESSVELQLQLSITLKQIENLLLNESYEEASELISLLTKLAQFSSIFSFYINKCLPESSAMIVKEKFCNCFIDVIGLKKWENLDSIRTKCQKLQRVVKTFDYLTHCVKIQRILKTLNYLHAFHNVYGLVTINIEEMLIESIKPIISKFDDALRQDADDVCWYLFILQFLSNNLKEYKSAKCIESEFTAACERMNVVLHESLYTLSIDITQKAILSVTTHEKTLIYAIKLSEKLKETFSSDIIKNINTFDEQVTILKGWVKDQILSISEILIIAADDFERICNGEHYLCFGYKKNVLINLNQAHDDLSHLIKLTELLKLLFPDNLCRKRIEQSVVRYINELETTLPFLKDYEYDNQNNTENCGTKVKEESDSSFLEVATTIVAGVVLFLIFKKRFW